MKVAHHVSRYPWQLITQIAARIEHDNAAEAHRLLERFLQRVEREHPKRLSSRKLRCGALLSHCLRAAHRGGAASERILAEHADAIERLTDLRSWSAVRNDLHAYVDRLLSHMRAHRHTDMEQLIDAIRADLRESPGKTRSLSEYAREADVSLAHLSRTFRRLVGSTFRDERRRTRLEQASTLLRQTTMKVRAIAQRVGQRDASRFIREFRREMGVTPGHYRLMHQSAPLADSTP